MSGRRTNPGDASDRSLSQALTHFWRLLLVIRPYWGLLSKGVALSLVVGLLALVPPYLSKLLIDDVYTTGDVTLLRVIVAGTLAIGVGSALMGAVRSYFALFVGARLSHAIGLLFFNHVQHLRAEFFERHPVGEIMSRFQDVRSSLNAVVGLLQTVFVNSVHILLVPPFLFWMNWRLALVALASVPLTTTLSLLSSRLLRRYARQTSESFAELNAYQVEVFTQIRTMKGLSLERSAFGNARRRMEEALQAQIRSGGAGQFFGAADGILRAAHTAVYMLFAWYLVLQGSLTLGELIAFGAYLGYLIGPVSRFATLLPQFYQSSVYLDRMFEFLDSPTERSPLEVYEPEEEDSTRLRGAIEFRDVDFGYTAESPLLTRVSLKLEPGSVTAIMGPSGAGKSTLFRLVIRFAEPTAGQVLIDGRKVEQYPLRVLRREISAVWQENGLVRGTVWENLTLGIDDVSQERVEEVVRLCRLEELIAALPAGYETAIGEQGQTLSAGQRQRISVARAVLRNAPVLLLDEATAHLDHETEMAIVTDLLQACRDTTIVYVTHRRETALIADRVLVLQGGRLFALPQALASDDESRRRGNARRSGSAGPDGPEGGVGAGDAGRYGVGARIGVD